MVTRIVLLILVLLFAPGLALAADVYHPYTDGDKTVSHVVLKWTRNAANWRNDAVSVLDSSSREVPKSRYRRWQKGWAVRIKSELIKTNLVTTQGKTDLREICAPYVQTDCIYRLAKINSLAGDRVLPTSLNVPTDFAPKSASAAASNRGGNSSEVRLIRQRLHAVSPFAPLGFAAPRQILGVTTEFRVVAPRNAGTTSVISARSILIGLAVLIMLMAIAYLVYSFSYQQNARVVLERMQFFWQAFKQRVHHEGYIDRETLKVEYQPEKRILRIFVPLPAEGRYPNLDNHGPGFRRFLRQITDDLNEPFILDGELTQEIRDFGYGPQEWIVVTFAYLKSRQTVVTGLTTQEVA
jgi:hypothetical protein